MTEIQPGDTPETMLRRADRALLTAKTNGRNTVVQLGSGSGDETAEKPPAAAPLFRPAWPKELLERDMITPVPVKMAIEKLRGFVADHRAKIVSVDGNRVRLEIEDRPVSRLRRLTDRGTAFRSISAFEEERLQNRPPGRQVAHGRRHDADEDQGRAEHAKGPQPASRRGHGLRRRGLGQLPLLPDGCRRRVRSLARRTDAGQAGTQPVAGEIRVDPLLPLPAEEPLELLFKLGPPFSRGLAFPDDEYGPAQLPQEPPIFRVPPPVSLEFRLPITHSAGGHGAAFPAAMTVPEAAVDENNLPAARKHEIGRAGKLFGVEAITESHRMHQSADR